MSGSDPSPDSVAVRRIRFTPQAVASGCVYRTFKHPRLCFAVVEPAALSDAPAENELHVAFVQPGAEAEWEAVVDASAPISPSPDARHIDVTWRGGRIYWDRGPVIVFLRGAAQEQVLAALVEFAFYEGELRRLEAEMDTREAPAADDVARSQTISRRDKAHWPRFRAAVEAFYRMRLTFARLAPRLAEEPQGLPSRRLASRLLARARAGARADALDARLEACEDLYEGANDRVADVKGWHDGFIMELIIVLLLTLEVILLCVDLVLRGGE